MATTRPEPTSARARHLFRRLLVASTRTARTASSCARARPAASSSVEIPKPLSIFRAPRPRSTRPRFRPAQRPSPCPTASVRSAISFHAPSTRTAAPRASRVSGDAARAPHRRTFALRRRIAPPVGSATPPAPVPASTREPCASHRSLYSVARRVDPLRGRRHNSPSRAITRR